MHVNVVNNQNQSKKKNNLMQTVLILSCAAILVMLSFLLAYKFAMFVFPFNSEQQLVVNYLQHPGVYKTEIITAGATAKELTHLLDVADLMQIIDIVIIPELLIGILLLISIGYLGKKELVKNTLKLSAFGGLIFSGTIGLLSVFFFDQTFEIFHQILFPQGNYQFSFDSFLIQTLPADVFFKLGLLIFLLAIAINVGYFVISLLIKKQIRNL